MKKSILLLLSVGIIGICLTELKAQDPNVPPGHDSYGIIYPPVVVDPTDPDGDLITIENTSGCNKIQLQFYMTVTWSDENEIVHTETKAKIINLEAGQSSLTTSQIKALFNAYYYGFTLSNISLNISIDEVYQEDGHIYPDPNMNSITISTAGKEKPCDCLHFIFDWTNRKIIITRPVPPCEAL